MARLLFLFLILLGLFLFFLLDEFLDSLFNFRQSFVLDIQLRFFEGLGFDHGFKHGGFQPFLVVGNF